MNKKILMLAVPMLLMACSPAEKESKNYDSLSKVDQMTQSPVSNLPNEATVNADPNTNKNPEPNTNIPGSTTQIPEITKADPPVKNDSTIKKGGKKNNPIEENNEMPAKELIQTADIKMQVGSLDHTSDTIEILVKKYNAYISTANQESSNSGAGARMMIRVRQENFSSLIRDIMHQSKFTNFKNIRTDDVTAEYVDIESRLKTKKEVEARYIDLLRNKAHSLDEILRAENEIRVVHEEIEAKTGRLNFIKDQVNYSTINLEFYQQTSFTAEPEQVQYSYMNDVGNAAGAGWSFIKNLVLVLIYIWPVYIFLIGIYLILKKYVLSKPKKVA